jgi:hypothetical protein
MSLRNFGLVAAVLGSLLALAGCGGGASSGSTSAAPSETTPTQTSPQEGSSALMPEAQQAAAGDIPDNQVFLTYRNAAKGYAIRYPEGWARRGSSARVTFQDKNNLVRVEVLKGSRVTAAGVSAEMRRLRNGTPSLRFARPSGLAIGGEHAVKVVYTTVSGTNPVTGKRVTLVVDRYYLPGPGRHAVVDLGTPKGVDNVDAYRLMIESFRWK